MSKLFNRARIGFVAAALLAFSIPLLTPKPAEAWWNRGGPGWNSGWNSGWGPGYGWQGGWRGARWGGCCYGPAIVGLPSPVFVGPPAYAYGPRPWIAAHWNGPYWVPTHWG